MKKIRKYWFSLIFLLMFAFFINDSLAFAYSIVEMSKEEYAQLLWGGILYDNWYSELDVKIEKTHPSYPSEGKKKGASTWRCKECHGWDYRGKDGAYSKGGHYTGIKGITVYANKNPDEIIKILKNDTHALGDMIPENAYRALTLFVAYGQIDMDKYIYRASKRATGNIKNGARIYSSTCVRCHGQDGKKINFKTEEKPEYIGTVSNKNPWETLHKIRFGQPSKQMISLLFLTIKDQIDVLSYCQILP